jgi:hypothetical protein
MRSSRLTTVARNSGVPEIEIAWLVLRYPGAVGLNNCTRISRGDRWRSRADARHAHVGSGHPFDQDRLSPTLDARFGCRRPDHAGGSNSIVGDRITDPGSRQSGLSHFVSLSPFRRSDSRNGLSPRRCRLPRRLKARENQQVLALAVARFEQASNWSISAQPTVTPEIMKGTAACRENKRGGRAGRPWASAMKSTSLGRSGMQRAPLLGPP